MAEWISVKDRLPEHDKPMLVCTKSSIPFTAAYSSYKNKWLFIGQYRIREMRYPVKYWMPLPEPPKEDE